MSKLDESQAKWIVRQRHKGARYRGGRGHARLVQLIKGLARRYRGMPVNKIVHPYTMGRPRGGLPGRRDHSLAISTCHAT